MSKSAVWSLRNALFRWLIGLTLALWALSAVIVYVEADYESQELFDQSLEETAHLLLSLAEYEVREHGSASPIIVAVPAERNHRQYLLYQIWDVQGRLLYKNPGAPDQPIWPQAHSGMRWLDGPDGRQRVYASWSNSGQLQIQVAEPVTHRKDISHRFAYKLSGFALALVALAALAIWWSVQRLFRGLQQSTGEVASRTPNDLADVSLAGVPREALPLLEAINRLFERVRRAMEREQRFTADAAHELRTPLAAIKTSLQVIQRARNDAEREEFLAALGVSVDRASRLVDQLLTLSRLDPLYQRSKGLELRDLATLIGEALPGWREAAARHQLSLHGQLEPAVCALNADAIPILLRNLVENAMRYTPAGGSIQIRCGMQQEHALLEISDSGPGIPAAMRERVFERFVRLADASQPGSGLGLSIVRQIAEMHGASISLGDGAGGRGLCIQIRFPVSQTTMQIS
ncbi:ATP-binding protein [Pseudoduganella danionis]|uniref:sensor histidine kinase n=1 Tax=Pseudoduganella danionis TaxID=1890295 RepID=UPI0035B0AC37